MAAAALVRSVASKMLSRAAAAPTSLIVRGLHGGASSGLVADVIQRGTADALVSAGMAAATGLRSGGAGRLTTKMAHAPPHPYHRLVHGRGIHSRTSPDPIPSTLAKVLDMASNAAAGVGFIALLGSVIYLHFWINPELVELKSMLEDLPGHGNTTDKGTGVIDNDKLGTEAAVKTMHSHENRIKALEARFIIDLKAENTELKIASDSAPSQEKV